MATISSTISIKSFHAFPSTSKKPFSSPKRFTQQHGIVSRPNKLKVQAAKLPPGVEMPKVEPKFEAPFLGFTTTAEIWNSRVCMIGLVGIFVIELIFHKGILQMIGVDVGKGLDLPL